MLLSLAVGCAAGEQECKIGGPNVPESPSQEMHTIRQSLLSKHRFAGKNRCK
jgi:hypothetical protein